MSVLSEEGLYWRGPVVWWNPVEGARHAFSPDKRLWPGQERTTLCGQAVTLIDPSEVDWLVPTCDTCMARAKERMHQREQRRQGWF